MRVCWWSCSEWLDGRDGCIVCNYVWNSPIQPVLYNKEDLVQYSTSRVESNITRGRDGENKRAKEREKACGVRAAALNKVAMMNKLNHQ